MTDPVQAYLKDIRPIPLLTAKEEIDIAQKVQQGDETARDKMIRSNLRLVISIAKRYMNMGIPFLDLIEEGNIGLIKGVEKFDPRKGFRFSTYGSWWIKQEISRAIVNQGKMIRIPVYMNEEIIKYKKAVEVLRHDLKGEPDNVQVAKKMRLSVEKVRNIMGAIAKMTSLNDPVITGQTGQIMDVIDDEDAVLPDEEIGNIFKKEQTQLFLDKLSEREQKVLRMRYALDDGKVSTLVEIAKDIGVSRERVRQIEMETIAKVRNFLKEQEDLY